MIRVIIDIDIDIDSIQYKKLFEKPCLNFYICLFGMFLNVKNYAVSCGVYDNGNIKGNTESGILRAPCGTIHIEHATEVPVDYTWSIHVPKHLKINTTVLKIDLPYETLNCFYNYLHIINIHAKYKTRVEDNARLCGQAWGKIFYSNTAFIRITLALKYARYGTVLSLLYQVHSNLRILLTQFKEKMLHKESGLYYNVQQLCVMTDNKRMDIYFYNTYIWNKIFIVMQKNRCPGNRALVYDGPNSRSKLLGESQQSHDGRDTFTSSLSIISIYLLDSPTPTCFNISVYVHRFKPHPTRQYHAFETSLRLRYELGAENIYDHIRIRVPIPNFINIKMNRFVYTGNTEASCYLGGIIIFNDKWWPPIGPLCGEVGRLIFEDKSLDGVTLNSNNTNLIIFLYSGQISKLLLEIIFSSDKCQGMYNIRDYHYSDKHAEHGMFKISPFSGKFLRAFFGTDCRLTLYETCQKCLKIQTFIDSFVTNTRVTHKTIFLRKDLFHRVKAVIKMVRHEGPCSTFNASPYIISFKDRFKVRLNAKNVTYISKSFSLNYDDVYTITTLHDITCAPMYDGVSEIIFQIREEHCPKITFPISKQFYVARSTTPKCSSTTVGLSDGIYAKSFTSSEGYQMNIQVYTSDELQHCTAREVYIVIKHVLSYKTSNLSEVMHNIHIWKMEQDRFELTIWGFIDSQLTPYGRSVRFLSRSFELYISVKSHSHNNVELYPNISSCYQTMHIEHQNKKAHDVNPSAKKYIYLNKRDSVHCLLSTCYVLYPFRTNVSWNSAQTLCQQDGMQLLTMNSDIKAQFIENILYDYIYLHFARDPLLFLNMKQDDKVCAIVLCAGYKEIFPL